jgi:hypothetical protein
MAERLAQARLGPQMESLRAELERAFALAFEPDAQTGREVLTLYASHDHALNALQDMAAPKAATAGRGAPGHSLLRQRGRDPRAERRPLPCWRVFTPSRSPTPTA